MPTVVDPETKEKTNPAEAPIVKERELFADEVEMERKSSDLGREPDLPASRTDVRGWRLRPSEPRSHDRGHVLMRWGPRPSEPRSHDGGHVQKR